MKSTDPVLGALTTQTVTATIKGHGTKHLVRVTLANGKSITATAGHPIWLPKEHRWAKASELRSGDWLQTSAGTYVQVTAVKAWTQTATVNNLTVSTTHTYYVLAGASAVLVHNCDKEISDVALGTSDNGLEEFANTNNYTHFMGETREDALANVHDVANYHPETKLHVRLDGFKMTSGKQGNPVELFDDAVKEGQGDNWYTTQKEMAILERSFRLGNLETSRLTFYMGGEDITAEILAGSKYLGGGA